MADSADSADFAAPGRSRGAGGASSKRRAPSASTVPAETDDKLARAEQSAQLSDAPRDDDARDLFPDDPTRAPAQSMTGDLRQGTLSGFELPQGAVEAAQDADVASAPAEPRGAARSKETTVGGADDAAMADTGADAATKREGDVTDELKTASDAGVAHDGGAVAVVEVAEPAVATGGPITHAGALVDESAAPVLDADAPAAVTNADAPVLPGRAAAEARAARASLKRRKAAAGAVAPAGDGAVATGNEASAPREAADVPQADAQAPVTVFGLESKADRASNPYDVANVPGPAAIAEGEPHPGESAASPAWRVGARTPVALPELDRARATAFVDAVDALYGAIADQRRAAADLARRMKWMLAIVVGALLATVGVGISQTLLLSRLAHDAAVQQQRTGQMLQTQQAALASMLERATAPASAADHTNTQRAAVHPAAPTPASAPAVRHRSHGHRAHSPARVLSRTGSA